MGTDMHCCWHWLHCSLPAGRWPLTALKLSHPQVIPIRDRMAAPLCLASWIRFETVMNQQDWRIFFHEYGRRVGMVPRSSLKEGKNRQMVEKGTKAPKPTQKPNTQARRPKLHHLVVFPQHSVKRVKLRLVAISGPEFAKEKDCSASCVHGKPPRRLQTDFPYQVLVTSGHTTVWQNKVTLQVRCLAMLQQWL